MSTSPIADLSYRGYDGPLDKPGGAWFIVARNLVQQAFRKRIYWVLTLLSGWYYFIMLVVVFFTERIASAASDTAASFGARGNPTQGAEQVLKRIIWKDQFINGYNFGQMVFMIIALYVAAGAIANDTRSNALLVYLSKPCSKLDYLLGKWVGAVTCIFVAMALPATFYYVFGSLGYNRYGFFSDPWLLPKCLGGMLIGAMIHGFIALGFSSIFKQGRMAGAAYASLYLFGKMFTGMMVVAWINATRPRGDAAAKFPGALAAFERLASCSVDGILMGIFKKIVGSDGSTPFALPQQTDIMPSPPLVFTLGIGIAVSVIAAFIMWNRVRAVEVIGG